MVRLTPRRRAALSETIRELANLVAAAWVVGEAIGERGVSWSFLGGGILLWIGFVSFALFLEGDR